VRRKNSKTKKKKGEDRKKRERERTERSSWQDSSARERARESEGSESGSARVGIDLSSTLSEERSQGILFDTSQQRVPKKLFALEHFEPQAKIFTISSDSHKVENIGGYEGYELESSFVQRTIPINIDIVLGFGFFVFLSSRHLIYEEERKRENYYRSIRFFHDILGACSIRN